MNDKWGKMRKNASQCLQMIQRHIIVIFIEFKQWLSQY